MIDGCSNQFQAGLYSAVAVKLSNSLPIPPSLQSGLVQSDRERLGIRNVNLFLTLKERRKNRSLFHLKKIMIMNLCLSRQDQVRRLFLH